LACHENSFALKSDGTVWAWGFNYDGQLGDGTQTHRWAPVKVSILTDIISISSGAWHAIALRSDGTVWAWGDGDQGQLGDGYSDGMGSFAYTPVQVLGENGSGYLTDVVSISAFGWNSMALKSDGTVWTWGNNNWGQLGNGNDAYGLSVVDGVEDTPVQVLGENGLGYLTNIINITVGQGDHQLALTNKGIVWAWGRSLVGSLGDGTGRDGDPDIEIRNTPVRPKLPAAPLFLGIVWTIQYDGNGNTDGVAPVDSLYEDGDQVTVLNSGTLVKAGYTFIGWNTVVNGSGGTSYNAGDIFNIVSDVKLYAQWQQNYTVTLPPITTTVTNTTIATTTLPGAPGSTVAVPTTVTITNTALTTVISTIPTTVVSATTVTNAATITMTSSSTVTTTVSTEVQRMVTVTNTGTKDEKTTQTLRKWALLNLILAITGIGVAILAVSTVRKDKKEEMLYNENTQPAEYGRGYNQRRFIWLLVSVIAAFIGVVFFFITEHMENSMIFVDKWTIVNTVVLVVGVVAAWYAGRRRVKDDRQPDSQKN